MATVSQIHKLLSNLHSKFCKSCPTPKLPFENKVKGIEGTKPNPKLNGTPECYKGFENLKMLLTTEPVLQHSDERCNFIIQVDVSDMAMAAAMLQEKEDCHLHSCVYVYIKNQHYGKTLGCVEQGSGCCETCPLHLVLPTKRGPGPI